jgi:nicotinate-nucleotide pyrophosphorylase (carboxylating)
MRNLENLIELALQEDLPQGDLTSDSLKVEDRFGRARLVAKEDLVLSGTEAFHAVITQFDPKALFNWKFKAGDFLLKGQIACQIKGNLLAFLKAERTALNFLGHLSGVATLTRCFVEKTKGHKTRILDTRKTLPGFRQLEKQAVKHGGGA